MKNTPYLDTNQLKIVAPRANTEPDFSKYWVHNGTSYNIETPAEVIEVLEEYRAHHVRRDPRARLVIHYGNGKTGQAWDDVSSGYIGRSTGTIKIPLLVHNRRSMGGPGLLDRCIVKIERARGKRILYEHPNYKPISFGSAG